MTPYRSIPALAWLVPAILLILGQAPAQTRQAPPASSDAPAPPPFPVGIARAGTAGDGGGVPPLLQEDAVDARGTRSVGLAVIYSLLLPGMGELYAGDYGSGKYFTGADGLLWLSLGAVDMHARSLRDDARAFAALHAGFSPVGKDDDYFVNVGNFDDVYGYNEQVLRDRDAYKLYDPNSSFHWNWDAERNRSLYRDQRVAADGMFNNTRFVVAGLLANRVLSAINAARIVISGNREAAGELGLGASVLGGPGDPHGVALTVTRRF